MPTETAIRPVGVPATVQAIIESSPCRRDTAYYAVQYRYAARSCVEGAVVSNLLVAHECRTATARGVNPHRCEARNLEDATAFEFRAAVARAELADRAAWLAANPGGYAGI